MAKKVVKKSGELPDPFEMMKSFDDQVEVLADSEHSKIKEWISTGWAVLNCCISGSMFKGIPSNKVVTLCGDSGTGKTYIACSIARNAQKMGKTILYLDSEGSMDPDFISRLGLDPKRVIIRQVGTVLEATQVLVNLCDQLKKQEEEYGKHNEFYVILDSISNLSSNKEKDDAMSGENKRDMTRQQQIKGFYRAVVSDMSYLNVGMTVVAHVYQSMSMFATNASIAGGSGVVYAASVILDLFAAKLQDKENDAAAAKSAGSDDLVRTGVQITAKPRKSRFTKCLKVRVNVPYFKAPNFLYGIEQFVNWDNAGVCRGTMIDEKEYNKMSENEQSKVHVWEFNGEKKYAIDKDTARTLVVKHLGGTVPIKDFFSDQIWTEDVLRELDENTMRPTFELPSIDELSKIDEIDEMLAEEGLESAESVE